MVGPIAKLFINVAGPALLAEAAFQRGAPLLEAPKVTGPSGTSLVNMGHISLIEAVGNYTRLTQSNGDAHMLRRMMVGSAKQLANTNLFDAREFYADENLEEVFLCVPPSSLRCKRWGANELRSTAETGESDAEPEGES
ncbi:MAG: hypothetical protein CK548_08670 [Opitutia bacterium]|nr:MAG: hypothetical protein CK548_08670 [Opitutae bacterium]